MKKSTSVPDIFPLGCPHAFSPREVTLKEDAEALGTVCVLPNVHSQIYILAMKTSILSSGSQIPSLFSFWVVNILQLKI